MVRVKRSGGRGFVPWRAVTAAEPRLLHVKRCLEAVLPVVELLVEDRPVAPNGFRLRHPSHWTVPSPDIPLTLTAHLGRTCNIHCDFCYIDGNPPTLAMARGHRPVGIGEMETRLALYDRDAGRELFPTHYQLMEVLNHPHALAILRRIRGRTRAVMSVTTAGTLLEEPMVAALAELAPIRLWLSLNIIDPTLRRRRLRDRNASVAVRSPELLQAYGIPYCVSIVPVPQVDLEHALETIRYVDQFAPGYVRVILPGFTDADRPALWHQRWRAYWHEIVEAVRGLRFELRTPIVIYPQIFEEIHYDRELNGVKILGAICGSPGAAAGLGWGSWIRKIDGDAPGSRDDVRDALAAATRAGRMVALEVETDGERRTVRLEQYAAARYPFSAEHMDYYVHSSPFGLLIGGGLRPAYFSALERLAIERGAREVWFVSSPLMKPLVDDMVQRLGFPRTPDVHFEFLVPRSHFMGGNVLIGEMMSCRDFYHAVVERRQQTCRRPDLLVVPATPFSLSAGWLRDLEGVFVADLQRALSVPVAVLPCDEIKY